MPSTHLSLKSLHLLSEGLADDFEQKVQQAVLDCHQRPSLPKHREVVIKMRIKPHPEDPDDVTIDLTCTSSTPAREVDSVRARRVPRSNQLQFDFAEESL